MMLKRTIAVLIAALMLFTAVSCTEPAETGKPDTSEQISQTEQTTETDEVTDVQTEAPEPDEPYTDRKVEGAALERWTPSTFKVSGVFTNDMVLQRDKIITIWGFANEEGMTVTGTFDGETAEGTVKDGEWKLVFSARPASTEPKTLNISDSRGNTAEITGILMGDVYMVSGQSNAELNLSACTSLDPNLEFDEEEPIRFFQQNRLGADNAKQYWQIPQADTLNYSNWCWLKPSRENSMPFSAIGFYVAKTMYAQTGVPVGVIMMAAGGCYLHQLMPNELREKLSLAGGDETAGAYYNTMIHPFVGLKTSGMIFFQGESDATNRGLANIYTNSLVEFVKCLREKFGYNFPFYNIQLSDYGPAESCLFTLTGLVRAAQYDAYKELDNSEITVSYDLGANPGYYDMPHSPKKKALAERICAVILAREFNTGDLSYTRSPEPESFEVSADKKTVTVKFKNVGDGLKSSSGDETVAGFYYGRWTAISGSPESFAVEAKITGKDTVEIKIPDKPKNGELHYALPTHVVPDTDTQLYNSNGVPVPTFTYTFK